MERYFRALQEYMNEVPSFWNGGSASMDSMDDDPETGDGGRGSSMDSMDDDPETGDFGFGTGSGGVDSDTYSFLELRARKKEAERLAAEAAARREAERLAAEEAARQEAARLEAQRARERREAEEREAARLEAEMAAEYARQEAARQEAVRQEAVRQEAARQEAARQEAARQEAARQEAARQEAARQEAARVAAEIARIEAEEAARFEAEMEAESARREAARQETERLAAEKAAEEERLLRASTYTTNPESLTDDELDEAIAAYSNADTAVASEVLGRLVEEKEIRTVEKAEEAENQRLLDQKQEFEEAEIESSDLPGSNVGISLGDLMAQYGVPSDKITYGIDGIPVIDLGMTTKEIDAIYGGDDQPEKPTTTQQIIDYATQKAIKTLDANQDGKVSALEFVAPFAVGASGLGIVSNVNTLANTLGITDKNIVNEIISSVEDGIESLIGFAIPKVGDPTEIDTPVTDLSMTTAEIDALQGGLDTPVTDLPPVPTSTEQSFAVPDFAPGITGKEIKGPQVRQDELDRAILDDLAEQAEETTPDIKGETPQPKQYAPDEIDQLLDYIEGGGEDFNIVSTKGEDYLVDFGEGMAPVEVPKSVIDESFTIDEEGNVDFITTPEPEVAPVTETVPEGPKPLAVREVAKFLNGIPLSAVPGNVEMDNNGKFYPDDTFVNAFRDIFGRDPLTGEQSILIGKPEYTAADLDQEVIDDYLAGKYQETYLALTPEEKKRFAGREFKIDLIKPEETLDVEPEFETVVPDIDVEPESETVVPEIAPEPEEPEIEPEFETVVPEPEVEPKFVGPQESGDKQTDRPEDRPIPKDDEKVIEQFV
jgi:hypothetical protein